MNEKELLTKYNELLVRYKEANLLIEKQKEIIDRQRERIEKAERINLLDPLTGAYNRNYYSFLEDFVGSVIMIDIDNFSNINNLYGHATGDEALIKATALIKKNTRREDYLIRHGGDEFLLFLNNCSAENAFTIMKKIKEDLKANNQSLDSKVQLQFTVSAGITYKELTDSLQKIIDVADHAMYDSKNSGKDSISVELGMKLTKKKLDK